MSSRLSKRSALTHSQARDGPRWAKAEMAAEAEHVEEAARAGRRLDGRSFTEPRALTLTSPTNPSLSGTNSSAHAKLQGSSATSCLCAVKPELTEPDTPCQASGSFRTSVESLGTHESHRYLSSLLSECLSAGPSGSGAPFSYDRLVAASGKAVWTICCDAVMIDEPGGSDACSLSLAASSSLQRADFPSVVESDRGELELAENADSRWQLDLVPFVAIRVARIATSLLVDPDTAEQRAANAIVDIVVRKDGSFASVRIACGSLSRADLRRSLTLAHTAGLGLLSEAEEQLQAQDRLAEYGSHGEGGAVRERGEPEDDAMAEAKLTE